MLRCIILDDYQDAALRVADWSKLAATVTVTSLRTFARDADELVSQVEQAEILVIMRERTPFPAAVLKRLPNLKLLVTTGMRNAAIDLAAARAQGIVVCGTGTGASPPMELTWALILGLARQVANENATLRANGPWQNSVGIDLAGATLGILGLGKIGTRIAQIGQAFDMKVSAWSPNLTAERAQAAGVSLAPSKEALLESSDFVTIHLVLAAATRGLLGEAELKRMRPEAFLINTSRAAIVDQSALLRALGEGWIAGAGVDVYETEPLPADSPFRQLPNVLALPHLGYVSRNNYRMFYTEAIEDIAGWLAGQPVRLLS